ncbi:MAG: hypothetical protein J6C59_09560 [Muribaculaceae bacterium]|nr:hypothetical protein [Muribaculaceae bacterium]
MKARRKSDGKIISVEAIIYNAKNGERYFPFELDFNIDAEGEDELLFVSRKKLQYFYERLRKVGENHAAFALQSLFGSKCLPDEEPLFSNQPENYNNENPIVANDNKPTESTCTDDCPSPCPSQHFDNIINQSFADHNRRHIAAKPATATAICSATTPITAAKSSPVSQYSCPTTPKTAPCIGRKHK